MANDSKNANTQKGNGKVTESSIVTLVVKTITTKLKSMSVKPELVKEEDVSGIVSTLIALGNLEAPNSTLEYTSGGKKYAAEVGKYNIDKRLHFLVLPTKVVLDPSEAYACENLKKPYAISPSKVLGPVEYQNVQDKLFHLIRSNPIVESVDSKLGVAALDKSTCYTAKGLVYGEVKDLPMELVFSKFRAVYAAEGDLELVIGELVNTMATALKTKGNPTAEA